MFYKIAPIPTVLNIDPYDGSNSSADKARLAGRYGSSFKRRNDVRRANLSHRRPNFQGFWALLHIARGTGTKSQSAPSQNPWKLRSYVSILRTVGIVLGLGLTPLGHTITAAQAENAAAMKPAGGAYKAVSDLVALPNHIPGIGTLFVDPKTLPAGPFAAYDKSGKLVSTVYMIPLKDMQAKKKFAGLDVAGSATTSVDMYYNAGHPGVDEPHYHIVLWHVDAMKADVK